MTTLNKDPNKVSHPYYPKADQIEPGIHLAFIKAELAKAGYTQRKIAKELAVNPITINSILKGKVKSRRIAEFIATKTGLTLEQMWPGGYPDEIKEPD